MATTLFGDTISADAWMHGLRDADCTVWSRPVRSPRLDAAYAAVHGGSGQPFPEHFPEDVGLLPKPEDEVGQAAGHAVGQLPLSLPYGGGGSSRESSPKVKRNGSAKQASAGEAEGDLRAVGLCQKPSALRTQEDIKFIQSYMCSLSYFFSLWPAPLQWELSRLLSAHILARREVALSRGRPPDRLYFVVQGRLDVRLPVPVPGGGREERTLAVLTRGHTVGEAVLLGSHAQHTSVVVSSSSAMLLSLSRPDFSRAFKEVLDIRQGERLAYLRQHPLLSGLGEGELEAASEVLGLAFFPPGTRLWPLDERERCLYFLAEGQAKVKRGGAAGAAAAASEAAAAAAAAGGDGAALASPSMYDRCTISILGPGDIFGLPSTEQALQLQLQQSIAAAGPAATVTGTGTASILAGPTLTASVAAGGGGELPPLHMPAGLAAGGGGATAASAAGGSSGGGMGRDGGGHAPSGPNIVIESYSQVKVYTVKYADYPRLPPAVQQVLQAANAFRWSYYEGRMLGLARMDHRRREGRREQLRRQGGAVPVGGLTRERAGGVRGAAGAGSGVSGGAGNVNRAMHSAAAAAAMQLAEKDKQLLARVPILSVSVARSAGLGPDAAASASGARQQAADARRAAAAAADAQRERERIQRRRAGGYGDDGDGEGDSPWGPDPRLPAWALPSPGAGGGGGGRWGGWGGGGAGSVTPTGTEGGGSPGGEDSPRRGTEPVAVKHGRRAGGLARQLKRAGSMHADESSLSSRWGRAASADGAGPHTHAAGAAASGAAGPNAKAMQAVAAAQLSRVLEAERRNFGTQRRPVLQVPCAQGDSDGGAGEYEDGASGSGGDSDVAPWAAHGSISGRSESSEDGEGRRRRPSPSTTQRSSRRRAAPAAPLTAQYLTCRAEPSPPRQPRVPLVPTLSLLPPSATTFPRVQTYRNQPPPAPPPHHQQQHSPRQSRSPRSPARQQHPGQPAPASAQPHEQGAAQHVGPHLPRAQQRLSPRHQHPWQQSQVLGLEAAEAAALAACEHVETEEPRGLIVTQSVRQRHVLLFQNAQAMVAAASHSRPWVKPARQPRPSYSRVARTSQAGSGSASGKSGSEGGGGAAAASTAGSPRRAPSVSGSGSAHVLPLPASRFGPGPSPGGPRSASLSARAASGGRRASMRPDDRLSRYGSAGRSSSAGGGMRVGSASASAPVGGGEGGLALPHSSGELPSPRQGFGGRVPGGGGGGGGSSSAAAAAALAAATELSFAHLGIREVDDEDDDSASSSEHGGGASGPGGDRGGGGSGGDGGGERDGDGGRADEVDDATLLARVPAALLGGKGKGGAKGGAVSGKATGEVADVRGNRLLQHQQQPQPQDRSAASAVPAQQKQQHTQPVRGQPLVSQQQQLTQKPGQRVPQDVASGPASVPTASTSGGARQGPGRGALAAAAELQQGSSSSAGGSVAPPDGLNFTMRRRTDKVAAAANATATGVASTAGGGGGVAFGASAQGGAGAASAPVGPAGGAGGLGARGGGALNASGGPRGPMDAEFPLDLDERSLHPHHPRSGGALGPPHTQHHLQAHVGGSPAPSLRGIGAVAGTSSGAGSGGGGGGVASGSGTSRGAPASTLLAAGSRPDPGSGEGPVAVGPIPGPSSSSGVGAASIAGSGPPSGGAVGLPPGIALGYLSLDPFAWAALAAQVGPNIRTPFSQENILPKPQW